VRCYKLHGGQRERFVRNADLCYRGRISPQNDSKATFLNVYFPTTPHSLYGFRNSVLDTYVLFELIPHHPKTYGIIPVGIILYTKVAFTERIYEQR
jgi:hypothetical protein